jgi:hypothetical protein
MVVSQASLLTIWAVLGTSDAGVRAPGFFAGVICLELVMYVGTQDDDFFWLVTIASLAMASVLFISRIWFAPLARFGSLVSAPDTPTFQFSIKGLLLLTLGVALSITVAKAINAYVGGPRFLVHLLFWAAAIAVTGLASSWATLTAAHPGLRSMFVLLLSAASGALVAFGFNEGWDTYFYLIAITVLQALIVLTTLLVVRSCGYRLTRRSMNALP